MHVTNAFTKAMPWLCLCLLSSCGPEKVKDSTVLDTYPIIKPYRIDTIFNKEYIAEINARQNVAVQINHGVSPVLSRVMANWSK
jgi:hypothetical protein